MNPLVEKYQKLGLLFGVSNKDKQKMSILLERQAQMILEWSKNNPTPEKISILQRIGMSFHNPCKCMCHIINLSIHCHCFGDVCCSKDYNRYIFVNGISDVNYDKLNQQQKKEYKSIKLYDLTSTKHSIDFAIYYSGYKQIIDKIKYDKLDDDDKFLIDKEYQYITQFQKMFRFFGSDIEFTMQYFYTNFMNEQRNEFIREFKFQENK